MTLTRGAPGKNQIVFQGRLPGGELPVGNYTMKLTATNGAGETSRASSISFTIAA